MLTPEPRVSEVFQDAVERQSEHFEDAREKVPEDEVKAWQGLELKFKQDVGDWVRDEESKANAASASIGASELSTMARLVYYYDDGAELTDKTAKSIGKLGWELETLSPPQGLLDNSDGTSIAWCSFIKRTEKSAVVSLKGTSRVEEWVAYNIPKIILGVTGRPYSVIVEVGVKIRDLIKSHYTVFITGHSLGGYLAEIIASFMDLPGVAFTAPGPGSHVCGKPATPDFRIINFENDKVGNYNYDKHLFPVTFIKDLGRDCHSMEQMEILMWHPDRRKWTNKNVLTFCSPDGRHYYHSCSIIQGAEPLSRGNPPPEFVLRSRFQAPDSFSGTVAPELDSLGRGTEAPELDSLGSAATSSSCAAGSSSRAAAGGDHSKVTAVPKADEKDDDALERLLDQF